MWKWSKYVIFSGPYSPVFTSNTGKYGPEKSPCLDTFYTEPLKVYSIRKFAILYTLEFQIDGSPRLIIPFFVTLPTLILENFASLPFYSRLPVY